MNLLKFKVKGQSQRKHLQKFAKSEQFVHYFISKVQVIWGICRCLQDLKKNSIILFQDFNKEAILQQFDLPQEERLLTVLKKSFPFYWHEKREEDLRQKMAQDVLMGATSKPGILPSTAYDMQVTSHTVLDGCIIITGASVYECRPRYISRHVYSFFKTSALKFRQ